MKLALEKKDSVLAAAQKEAQDKTALADQKLASVEALEGEVTKLKSCLNESNREVSRMKKEKITLNEKLESAVHKRNDMEAYLRTLAKKLYLMLEGISFNPTVLMFAIVSCSVEGLIFGCRFLPRLRRGNWKGRDGSGPYRFSSLRRNCDERAPTGVPYRQRHKLPRTPEGGCLSNRLDTLAEGDASE